MRTAYRAEEALNQLIPMESYRSPLVPTMQFGAPVLLGAVTPAQGSDQTMVEPIYWFAIDLATDAVIAFARTSVMSPRSLANANAGGFPSTAPPMHPRDAHAVIRETRESIIADFSAGRAPEAETAAQVSAAFASAIPAALQPWLRSRCADFFDWLGARGGPTR